MKKIALVILIAFPFLTFGQEKIATNTYLYGNLENSIKGKVLIWYGFDDPKGEMKAIDIFKKDGIDAISWNKLFLPGQEYSSEEINQVIERESIETIIEITHNGTSTYTQSRSTTGYNSNSNTLYTYGSSYGVVGNVGLVFNVYNSSNGFSKPVAVINSNANNGWGAAGSERGLIRKIINRFSNKIISLN